MHSTHASTLDNRTVASPLRALLGELVAALPIVIFVKTLRAALQSR